MYWTKENGNLAGLIEKADQMEEDSRKEMGERAKNRIKEAYSWGFIVHEYEKIFLETGKYEA